MMRKVFSAIIGVALLLALQAGMARADYLTSLLVDGGISVASGKSPSSFGYDTNITGPFDVTFYLSSQAGAATAYQASTFIYTAKGLEVSGAGGASITKSGHVVMSGSSWLGVSFSASGPSDYTLSAYLDKPVTNGSVSFSFTDNGVPVVPALDTTGSILSSGVLPAGAVVLSIATDVKNGKGTGDWYLDLTTTKVPLPPSALLLGIGLLPLALARRQKLLGK